MFLQRITLPSSEQGPFSEPTRISWNVTACLLPLVNHPRAILFELFRGQFGVKRTPKFQSAHLQFLVIQIQDGFAYCDIFSDLICTGKNTSHKIFIPWKVRPPWHFPGISRWPTPPPVGSQPTPRPLATWPPCFAPAARWHSSKRSSRLPKSYKVGNGTGGNGENIWQLGGFFVFFILHFFWVGDLLFFLKRWGCIHGEIVVGEQWDDSQFGRFYSNFCGLKPNHWKTFIWAPVFSIFFLGTPKKLQKKHVGLQIHQTKSSWHFFLWGGVGEGKKSFPRCNLGIFTKDASHHPGGDNVLSCETWRVKKIAMFDICY